MSGRGVWLRGTSRGGSRGRGGRSYKSGDGDKAVSVGRTKGSASYTMTEKGAMSMSEISSLTDISIADLTCLDVGLQSSLLKVNSIFIIQQKEEKTGGRGGTHTPPPLATK